MSSKTEICVLCGKKFKGKGIMGHHMSYDPEIMVYLCVKCHTFLHLFPLFNKDQLEKVRQWSIQYADQWKNGTSKYMNSSYKKKKCNEMARDWREKNREKVNKSAKEWRKRNPDYIKNYHIKKRHGKKDEKTLNLFPDIVATA